MDDNKDKVSHLEVGQTAILEGAKANTDAEHCMTLTDGFRYYPKAVFFCFVLSLSRLDYADA